METAVSKIELMRKNGYSFGEIAKTIKCSRKRAWKHGRYIDFSEEGKERYFKQVKGVSKRIKSQQNRLSSAKTRVIGHSLFDGAVFLVKYHYTIKYVNSSEELVNQFIQDVKQVYGLDPSSFEVGIGKLAPYFRVGYFSNKMYNDLLKYTKSYSTSNETSEVPKEIFEGPKNIKIEFLRTFWEDEGSISKLGRLMGYVKNKKIISQLSELHKQFDIAHNVYSYANLGGLMYKIYVFKTKENMIKFYNLKLFRKAVVTKGYFAGKKKADVLKSFISKIDL